ncbi:MAG TPA: biotin/lipoyl-containing protein [Vicinamibacterales bacterium]|nr:biotin/lipoyl-containing protein [Vicinamibacterales bacterium]
MSAPRRRVVVRAGDRFREVEVAGGTVVVDGEAFTVESPAPGEIVVSSGARRVRLYAAADGHARWIGAGGRAWRVEIEPAGTAGRPRRPEAGDSLSAPMPATVTRIAAPPGTHVRAGDILLVLEAMKMELPLRAPRDGVVRAVRCSPGELVQPGVPLVELA